MEKSYKPQLIEQKWSQFWEKNHYGKPSGTGTPYCIMIPPPNVTGSLHMGHGFQLSIMDALIRYHKMRGYNTLWQVGTDHAGIATQMLVERNLEKQGITKESLGREGFLEKVWEWKQHSGNTITQQMRRLGIMVDWSRERFTLDEGLSEAVRTLFVRLYNKGLIYRGERLVNWDTTLQTAVSDLEIQTKTCNGHLWSIQYPLVNSDRYLTVATTRPETLFGDMAIAVHPEDPRYQDLIGQSVRIPVSNREIPIIADEYVDQTFGTGCVKITPSHDFNDFEVGQRHKLPSMNIMNPNGTLNNHVPEHYRNMSMAEARKQLIAELESLNLLANTEAHTMQIPIGDRSGTVLEPYLTKQWFVKAKPLAEKALHAAQQKDVQFHPNNWINTYSRWMEDIQDWCISRQLWWGHRIPAWYDQDGNVYVGDDEHSIREQHQLTDEVILTQDEDVLDTWFSSALWPFSTLGWPGESEDLKTYYPTSCLVTGFDIIFFWVARMVMMGLECLNEVPFKDVYITGLIRDFKGDKMSKSKGNVIDPIDIIDGISLDDLILKRTSHLMQPELANKIQQATRKEFPAGIDAYGTDALRFTFCAMATTGRDVKFDTGRLQGYSNFCNKIWNSARFILMLEEKASPINHAIKLPISDWMREKLVDLEAAQKSAVEKYRFDQLCSVIYHGFWHEFCDWYLELIKASMDILNTKEKQQMLHDAKQILLQLLRIMHPLIPFITDEIYSTMQTEHKSILDSKFVETTRPENHNHALEITEICEWIQHVRTIRSELNVPPSAHINSIGLSSLTSKHVALFQKMTRLVNVDELLDTNPISCDLGSTRLELGIGEHIDIAKEIDRLERQVAKKEKEYAKIESKATNKDYLARAPQELIDKDRARLHELKNEIDKTQKTLHLLGASTQSSTD